MKHWLALVLLSIAMLSNAAETSLGTDIDGFEMVDNGNLTYTLKDAEGQPVATGNGYYKEGYNGVVFNWGIHPITELHGVAAQNPTGNWYLQGTDSLGNQVYQWNGDGGTGYELRDSQGNPISTGAGYGVTNVLADEGGVYYSEYITLGTWDPPPSSPGIDPPTADAPPVDWYGIMPGESWTASGGLTVQQAIDQGLVPPTILSFASSTDTYISGTMEEYRGAPWRGAVAIGRSNGLNGGYTASWVSMTAGNWVLQGTQNYGADGDGGGLIATGTFNEPAAGNDGDDGTDTGTTPPPDAPDVPTTPGDGTSSAALLDAMNKNVQNTAALLTQATAAAEYQGTRLADIQTTLASGRNERRQDLQDIENELSNLGFALAQIKAAQDGTTAAINDLDLTGSGGGSGNAVSQFSAPVFADGGDVDARATALADSLNDLPDAAALGGSDTWSYDVAIPWVDGGQETFSIKPPDASDSWYSAFNTFIVLLRAFLTVCLIWAFKVAIVTTLRQY